MYQAFGSTIQSVTTVVAAYMGGLGLGAWWIGRRGDRHERPAALYGWLEIAIAGYGVLSPLILALAGWVYIALAGRWGLTGAGSIALRFGLAALVLLPPTTLMGATLPVLTRAFAGPARDALAPELARLYGLNTLGAVVGAALAGFFLVEQLGIRLSLWLTGGVNLLLGVVAIRLARPLPPVPTAPRAETPIDRYRLAALTLLAITGFAALLYEIAWTRTLVMIVGGSSYAFTLVLVVFLLGIGIGSAAGARGGRGRPVRETAATAAMAQSLTAAGAALLFLFFHELPVYIMAVLQRPEWGAGLRLALLGVAVGAVVLVPAIGMGLTFPALADLLAARDQARGAEVGRAYGVNTIGSIAGAVLTGFVLVVWLGTDVTLRLGLGLSGMAALALVALAVAGVAEGSIEHRRLRARVLGASALATAALVVGATAPRWDTRLIDLAPTIYARSPMSVEARQRFLDRRGSRQLAFLEGRNATVSVWEDHLGRSLRVNGKVDASDFTDMDTQVMVGLAAAVARPAARAALVIGHGSGVSAGVLAAVPGMERVQIVELEPAVLAADPYFRYVNGSVLSRPTVSTRVDDARSALLLTRERFDVMVSEPSNPWVAGVATLYTPEFFRIVRSRLSPDGVFGQWIQLYQLPLPVLAGIVRNIREVFPHVEMWMAARGDVVVLGSQRPPAYDAGWLRRLLGPDAPLETVGREWLGLDTPEDYQGRLILGPLGMARLAAQADLVHTDDRPELEFVAARRFLADPGGTSLLDTLLGLRVPEEIPPPHSIDGLAKAMVHGRWDQQSIRYFEAAARAHAADPSWTARIARARVSLGDTQGVDTTIRRALRRDSLLADGWIAGGLLAMQRGSGGLDYFTRALRAGGDTSLVATALAVAATQERDWRRAEERLRLALAAWKGTLRHPVPRDLLARALKPFAFDGPPQVGEALITAILERQPGWAYLYELRIVAALRGGHCEVAERDIGVLDDFGIEWPDLSAELERCRAGPRV